MTTIRVVDFETSGTEPPAEVCEVGISDFNLEANTISGPGSWLCKVIQMPPEVRAIHHISKAECDPCEPFEQEDIRNFDGVFADAYAAHNSEFETKFWTPDKPIICTYKAALRVWPDAPSHSNNALAYWLEDQGKMSFDYALSMPAHRAGPDAYVTAHLIMALFDAGVTGKQMVAWTKEPRLLPRCPIGKHKGKPWAEVDDGFLNWMIGNATMEADLKWNAKQELDRRA